MRGSNMKKRRLFRTGQPIRLSRPLPEPEPVIEPEDMIATKRQRSLGLRRSLEVQFCGGKPSPVQASIINALVKLDDLQKSDALNPRDLVATFSSQKSLIKLLNDLKTGGPGVPDGESRFAALSEAELEQEISELEKLVPRLPGLAGSFEQEMVEVNRRLDKAAGPNKARLRLNG